MTKNCLENIMKKVNGSKPACSEKYLKTKINSYNGKINSKFSQ